MNRQILDNLIHALRDPTVSWQPDKAYSMSPFTLSRLPTLRHDELEVRSGAFGRWYLHSPVVMGFGFIGGWRLARAAGEAMSNITNAALGVTPGASELKRLLSEGS